MTENHKDGDLHLAFFYIEGVTILQAFGGTESDIDVLGSDVRYLSLHGILSRGKRFSEE
jgi:hypothetical protein